jgi:hypothetical protein
MERYWLRDVVNVRRRCVTVVSVSEGRVEMMTEMRDTMESGRWPMSVAKEGERPGRISVHAAGCSHFPDCPLVRLQLTNPDDDRRTHLCIILVCSSTNRCVSRIVSAWLRMHSSRLRT